MGEYTRERYTAPGGKPGYKVTSGVKEDLKKIVSDVSRMLSPSPLRDRKNTVDDAVDSHDRQNTDRHNRY